MEYQSNIYRAYFSGMFSHAYACEMTFPQSFLVRQHILSSNESTCDQCTDGRD